MCCVCIFQYLGGLPLHLPQWQAAVSALWLFTTFYLNERADSRLSRATPLAVSLPIHIEVSARLEARKWHIYGSNGRPLSGAHGPRSKASEAAAIRGLRQAGGAGKAKELISGLRLPYQGG